MKKVIRLTENDLENIINKIISEQIVSGFKSVIDTAKKTDLWSVIRKSANKDLVKYIYNVTSQIPSLKGREKQILDTVLLIDSNPLPYFQKFSKKRNISEQTESSGIDWLVNLTLASFYIWLGYIIIALPTGLPINPTVDDIKDIIKRRKEGRIAARKQREWEKWINSDEYKQQEAEKLRKQEEIQRDYMIEREKELKKEREQSANKANQKSLELEELKRNNAPLSKIKSTERLMILFQRDSYPKDSNEWRLMDQKLQSMEGQIQAALEDERKQEELKREEERKKQLEILYQQRAELEKQIELERQRLEKLNAPLKRFVGKTVNFYNDKSQQILYGKDTIERMVFDDTSKLGSRSGIYIYTDQGLEYEIICLSNPNRLADYFVLHSNIKDLKYNSSFINAVKQVAPSFCKKPKADFSAVRKPVSSKKIA